MRLQTIDGSQLFIPGTVMWFATGSAPTGFIKANGAEISRSAYADLFSVIGTTYGSGNTSTTFNVPDLRGEFVRGYDDGRGIDTGRVFGSWQVQGIVDHQHVTPSSSTGGAIVYRTATWMNSYYVIPSGFIGPLTVGQTDTHYDVTTGSIDGNFMAAASALGAETRPRNVSLLACIKY